MKLFKDNLEIYAATKYETNFNPKSKNVSLKSDLISISAAVWNTVDSEVMPYIFSWQGQKAVEKIPTSYASLSIGL